MTQRPTLGRLSKIIGTVILVVAVLLGIGTFVAVPLRVDQAAMETTLSTDQYLIVDKLTPHWADYKRGDIVVFTPPASYANSNGEPFIKRVVGLGGDHVLLQDGRVSVNGTTLDEPYVFTDGGGRQATDPAPGGASEWIVPRGELLVLGDYRRASADSRSFGPIAASQVIGRAWVRFWPLDTLAMLSNP